MSTATKPQPAGTRPRRFRVCATRANGSTVCWTAIGGSSFDHTLNAMDAAGLGGAVRVRPLPSTTQEARA